MQHDNIAYVQLLRHFFFSSYIMYVVHSICSIIHARLPARSLFPLLIPSLLLSSPCPFSSPSSFLCIVCLYCIYLSTGVSRHKLFAFRDTYAFFCKHNLFILYILYDKLILYEFVFAKMKEYVKWKKRNVYMK